MGLLLLGSGFLAHKYYKTSVHSKEETRQEVINDIKNSNQRIVEADIHQALSNERKMLMDWAERNPNDSKSLQIFREGIITANPQITLFENAKDDDIYVGK